jgi:hypothetical protein
MTHRTGENSTAFVLDLGYLLCAAAKPPVATDDLHHRPRLFLTVPGDG